MALPSEAALLQQEMGDIHQLRGKQGRPKLISTAVRQAIASKISADHHLSIMVAAAKGRREEMVWGTKYSGACGAMRGRWASRSGNGMQSNEEGRSAKQQRNHIANHWALGDFRWSYAITMEPLSR
jgi:hypothetical protein